jgi:XTP/dITP diphosphohydrolase
MSSEFKPVLVVASLNVGKVREIESGLADFGYEVVGLANLPNVRPSPEAGSTFEANARQKAAYYSRLSDHLTVADDSGLEVDALGGLPGVHSARFLSESATDEQRSREILARMEGIPEPRRGARFVCCLVVARQGQVLEVFEGGVEGSIAREPRGNNGFGYDPIFLLPSLGRTMAELTAEEKNRWSHRGLALQKLRSYLRLPSVRNSEKDRAGKGF